MRVEHDSDFHGFCHPFLEIRPGFYIRFRPHESERSAWVVESVKERGRHAQVDCADHELWDEVMRGVNVELRRIEAEVLRAVATYEYQELAAEKLGMATQTLKNHLHSAYRKLGTRNSLGAMKAMGWLKVPR